MQKDNKHSVESEEEVSSEHSDNVAENKDYVKRLNLQRMILEKIVNDDVNQITKADTIETDSLISN